MNYGKAMLIMMMTMCSVICAKDYLGAELYSTDQVKYGRFEWRMMAANGSGTLSTFFLYYNDSWLGDPEPWREVDMEVLGKDNNAFQSNIITGNAASKITSEEIHSFDTDLTTSFHTYAIEWTPDYIAWFFDGEEVRRSTGQQVIDCRDKPQSYRFNTWISSVPAWVGAFDPAVLPLYQYLNWIKYYEYTPGQGENGSDFSFAWEDNFDSFDTGRWAKGDWTFDQNLVDFSPNNIVVKDGYLILCLTEKNASGHTGETPDDLASAVTSQRPVFAQQKAAPAYRTFIPAVNSQEHMRSRFTTDMYNVLGRKIEGLSGPGNGGTPGSVMIQRVKAENK
ncbi:MAG: family 16 glycosylhydrolase [Chitinivibrionales bacterium]